MTASPSPVLTTTPITERQQSLFFAMGFPKPVEATLSAEGVGWNDDR